MPDSRERLMRWSAIDREASEAERQLSDKFVAYATGNGPAPSLEEIDKAKALRRSAASLLDQLVDDLQRDQAAFRERRDAGNDPPTRSGHA